MAPPCCSLWPSITRPMARRSRRTASLPISRSPPWMLCLQPMKFLYSGLPEVHVGGKKLVGRVVFGLLLLASALTGALSGLLIVYSTDLPQMSELERYRPSTITELYDAHGQVIGSFAL